MIMVEKKNSEKSVKKRVRMLYRRLMNQNAVITSLEEKNMELCSELNISKISLANLSDEYNKLLSINFEQLVRLNHLQGVNTKLKSVLENVDANVIEALKSLGNSSEMLLNLKKNITDANTIVSECKISPSQQIFQNRKGTAINRCSTRTPLVLLERLPRDVNLRHGEGSEDESMKFGLSPIPEGLQSQVEANHHIKSCLGSRGLNSQDLLENSLRIYYTEYPVIRSSDGPSNLTYLKEKDQSNNESPIDPRTPSPSNSPSMPTSPSFISETLKVPTTYITVSKRRKRKFKENEGSRLEACGSDECNELPTEDSHNHSKDCCEKTEKNSSNPGGKNSNSRSMKSEVQNHGNDRNGFLENNNYSLIQDTQPCVENPEHITKDWRSEDSMQTKNSSVIDQTHVPSKNDSHNESIILRKNSSACNISECQNDCSRNGIKNPESSRSGEGIESRRTNGSLFVQTMGLFEENNSHQEQTVEEVGHERSCIPEKNELSTGFLGFPNVELLKVATSSFHVYPTENQINLEIHPGEGVAQQEPEINRVLEPNEAMNTTKTNGKSKTSRKKKSTMIRNSSSANSVPSTSLDMNENSQDNSKKVTGKRKLEHQRKKSVMQNSYSKNGSEVNDIVRRSSRDKKQVTYINDSMSNDQWKKVMKKLKKTRVLKH